MQIISNTTKIQLEGSNAVAIGKFDGIHVGHKKLLDEIIRMKQKNMSAVVFTFDPSPEELFTGKTFQVLDTKEEKRKKFEQMGIDYLVEFPLTYQTAAISPESFMEDVLYKKLHTGFLASGVDLSFGDKGRGNAQMLQAFAREKNFEYKMIDKVCIKETEVSSTKIRELVEQGAMEEVAGMLGAPYSVSGRIIHGNHVGHTLNMPTVNIVPQPQKLLPPNGVYATISRIEGNTYYGVTNIGFKPTVSEENHLGVETYLYHVQRDLYGKEIDTSLVHFMRREKKFTSMEELKQQLTRDREAGQSFFNE